MLWLYTAPSATTPTGCGNERRAPAKRLIVVCPNGMNTNYGNWPTYGLGYNMYDFLFDELMPLVYGWYPASDEREDNFIAGLSMDGGPVSTPSTIRRSSRRLPVCRRLPGISRRDGQKGTETGDGAARNPSPTTAGRKSSSPGRKTPGKS